MPSARPGAGSDQWRLCRSMGSGLPADPDVDAISGSHLPAWMDAAPGYLCRG